MDAGPKVNASVLYAEDDDVIRRTIGRWLEGYVTQVQLAADGAQALRCFERAPSDLVITDLSMPVLDGVGLVRAIRQRTPSTQVIVTTAHSHAEAFLKCIEAGVDGYVLKPIDRDLLLSAVHKSLLVVAHARAVERHARERERLIQDLQAAAHSDGQAAGLVVMCACCKSIRETDGAWVGLEGYLARHAGLVLSHGICPPCRQAVYPEYLPPAPTGQAGGAPRKPR